MTAKRAPLVLSALAAALCLLAGAGAAEAKQYKFIGMHPVPGSGGGFCHIEAPHVHVYQPQKAKQLYRMHDDQYYFVGDPVAHGGYDGPKHSYYGHHPIQVEASLDLGMPGDHTEYCYLDGPHFHYYAPPFGVSYVTKAGVHFYAGEYPQVYEHERPDYVEVNAVYKPMKYTRPVYVEAPPAEYHGPVLVIAPVRPAVVVETPVVRAGVEVVVPAPVLEVEVGLPSLVIGTGHHHHHDVIVVDGHHRHGKFKHKRWGRGHGRRGRH